ncbi:MAG: folate family ECF transporter S component [Oscillospiraceae bacterium]|nr:folate family ECF transporter S component [Oscillospiraceae bacterium]
MSEPAKTSLAPGLFRTPFSRAYWRCAAREFTNVKMLAVAAVLIAVRVALKPLSIPLSPNLNINFGFFVNALGAMIFGPVVAIPAAAISDTLGCILFPNGPYFFPFILTEIAGSLIFALFLYRAPLTGWRVTLSRFAVCFLVNIVIQTPIMLWYYKLMLGKSYAIFDLPRICKNLALFPFESLLLLLFLNALRPVTYRMKLTYDPPRKLEITKRLVIFVVALFLIGAIATGAYYVYDYQTNNFAKDFSKTERADFNRDLAEQIGADEDELVLVNKINRTVFRSEQTVTYTVYKIDPSIADPDALWGLKNSEVKEIAELTLVEKDCVLVMDGK